MNKVKYISAKNQIEIFIHCRKCMDEKPTDISPKDYQQIQVGFTELGIQVWCNRHNCNIIHIDFEGQDHPANENSIDPTIQSIFEKYGVSNESSPDS